MDRESLGNESWVTRFLRCVWVRGGDWLRYICQPMHTDLMKGAVPRQILLSVARRQESVPLNVGIRTGMRTATRQAMESVGGK